MKLHWDVLLNDEGRFPRTLLFEEFSDERFRYGINEKSQPCLFFHFPAQVKGVVVSPVTMVNISFEETTVEGKPTLILTLLNQNFSHLFDDLIINIVDQTRITNDKYIKSAFISLCNKWFEFFESTDGSLTEYELQGIYAELYFLKFLLETSRFHSNELLSAWKGPFGKGHDFEIGDLHFEIKGISSYRSLVPISSEFQLDYLSGQQLYLAVMMFSPENVNGTSLSDITGEIAFILRSRTGVNIALFWNALKMTGLNTSNIEQYNAYTFTISRTDYYNCCATDFPALRRSHLPDAIRNIKYEVSLSEINVYKLDNINAFL